jgi:hypothetical protein
MDNEFADKSSEELNKLKKSLEQSIYKDECYSISDMTLLFRVEDELNNRK